MELPAVRNDREADFFHCALTFFPLSLVLGVGHSLWHISRKFWKSGPWGSPSRPPSVANAGLSLEIWGWAFAGIWYCCSVCYRWHLAPPPPSSGQTPGSAGPRHPTRAPTLSLSPGAGVPATHAGDPGPVPSGAPAAGETLAPHGVLFGFPWRLFPRRFVCFSSNYRCRENRLTSWERDKCSLWRIPGQDFKWNHMPEKNLIPV